MFDELDPRSPVPLYEQIARRIRISIGEGEYAEGEALPSVRRLATSLRVNPATVVQAYRDLETEGFVEMRHGAGTFVQALSEERRAEERTRQARDLVQKLLSEAARLGIRGEDLRRAMDRELGGRTHA